MNALSDYSRRNAEQAFAASEIGHRLDTIVTTEKIKILYACESGSRAWGFASPDSDYDVRFVYLPQVDHYLTVSTKDPDIPTRNRDVFDPPVDGDWDLHGWDLRKALELIFKSNPTIFEWLQSPIVYREDSTWITQFRQLAQPFYSPMKAQYHYYAMASNNLKEHLQGDAVRYKKYLYVLRPLLCVQWLREGRGIPPMQFKDLVETLVTDTVVRNEIEALLEIKMRGSEAEYQSTRPILNTFIRDMLYRYSSSPDEDKERRPSILLLDRFLRDTMMANFLTDVLSPAAVRALIDLKKE